MRPPYQISRACREEADYRDEAPNARFTPHVQALLRVAADAIDLLADRLRDRTGENCDHAATPCRRCDADSAALGVAPYRDPEASS